MTRPHPALIELAAGRSVESVEDVPLFLKSAMEHRMTGLVWRSAHIGDLALGPALHRDLATQSLITEQRHRRLSSVLVEVNGLLAEKGIDVATFKGVAAEQRWYDGIGDRPCWDVDLLVAPHSLGSAGRLVEALDPQRPNDGRIQRLVDGGDLQTIDVLFNGVMLDIHFDLFKLGFRGRQPQQVWENAVQVPIADGKSVLALGSEVSLVFSLLHLNRDRFAKLLGFVEVLRIVDRGEVDWGYVKAFVHDEGLETPHALALGVVLDTLGVDRPRPVPPDGWRSRVWNAAWPQDLRLLGEEGRLRFGRRGVLLFPFLVRGRIGDACRYVLRRLLPKKDMVDLVHPGTSGRYFVRLVKARVTQRLLRRSERKALDATRRSGNGAGLV